jgi:hypothetical protein
VNEIGPNFIARPYRRVSVQDVETLEPIALARHLEGRRAYRRTDFVVAVCDGRRALAQLERAEGDEILVPVRRARVLAGPSEVAFVEDESVDTANASQLARAALNSGSDARVYVIQGRFQHVNFIVEPAPLHVRVVEVVPPEPPKLLEMARTVLDYDEDLPPLELDLVPIDLRALARAHPAERYLFPCRCAGLELGARVEFLDAGPPSAGDWTLVGCERSRQIHVALYGHEPHDRVDFCPLVVEGDRAEEAPTLLKCCLRERGVERSGRRLIVPWGASLEEVRQALHALAGITRFAEAAR